MSLSEKRDRLKAFIEMRAKIKSKRGEHYLKRSIRPKKLSAHMYKKMFQNARQKMKASNKVNDMIARESCSGSNRKKQRVALESERVCFGNQEAANEPSCSDSMDGAQCETLLKTGETADTERGFWRYMCNMLGWRRAFIMLWRRMRKELPSVLYRSSIALCVSWIMALWLVYQKQDQIWQF